MFALYRYGRREYAKRQAERQQAQGDGPQWETELNYTSDPSSRSKSYQATSGPPQKPSFPFKKFLILAIGLFIPIFLETLDYTGALSFACICWYRF